MKLVIYSPYHKSKRIKIFIPYEMTEERKLLKTVAGRFYHKQQKLWSIPNTKENFELLKTVFNGKYKITDENTPAKIPKFTLKEKSVKALYQAVQKLTLKAYSPNTINTYKSELIYFLKYFETFDLKNITKEQIESYIFYMITKYKISESKQNTAINAIKFYYEQVLDMPREYYDIQRPKRAKTLPDVLSQKEVYKLINSLENLKHKAILYTNYGCGLRMNELLNLRADDIRSDDMYIFIKGAKGKKDRRVILS